MTPDVSPREMQVELAYIRSTTGLTLDAEQASAYLRRMQLEVRALPGGQALGIRVPVTRSDILHREHGDWLSLESSEQEGNVVVSFAEI